MLQLRIASRPYFHYHKLADFDPSQNFDLSIPYDRSFQTLQNATFSLGIGEDLTDLWPLKVASPRCAYNVYTCVVAGEGGARGGSKG